MGGRISLTWEGRRRRFIVFLRSLMIDDPDIEIKFGLIYHFDYFDLRRRESICAECLYMFKLMFNGSFIGV